VLLRILHFYVHYDETACTFAFGIASVAASKAKEGSGKACSSPPGRGFVICQLVIKHCEKRTPAIDPNDEGWYRIKEATSCCIHLRAIFARDVRCRRCRRAKNHYTTFPTICDRDVIPDVSFSLSTTAALRITEILPRERIVRHDVKSEPRLACVVL